VLTATTDGIFRVRVDNYATNMPHLRLEQRADHGPQRWWVKFSSLDVWGHGRTQQSAVRHLIRQTLEDLTIYEALLMSSVEDALGPECLPREYLQG
jgi:hypothetical protein